MTVLRTQTIGVIDAVPNSGTTAIVPLTTAAGDNLIVVQIVPLGGATVTAVRFGAVAMTLVGTALGVTTYQLVSPSIAASSVNIDLSIFEGLYAEIFVFSGANVTTPLGSVVSASGTSAAPSSGNVTCPSGGMVLGLEYSGYLAGAAPTAGSGCTIGHTVTSGNTGKTLASATRSTTGDISFGLSGSTAWNAVAYPVNDSAAATSPGAPTIGTATAGSLSASVTFTAPASNGGSAITGYTATASPGGLTGTGATGPITVSGLTAGASYTLSVTATNAIGTGAASAASNSIVAGAAATVPGAPTVGALTNNGNGTITIAGTAPASNGGAAITRYIASSSVGNVQAAAAGLPIIIANVSLVSQTVMLRAENGVGLGPASAASNAVTPTTGSGGGNIPPNPGAAGTVTLPVFKISSGQVQANLSLSTVHVQTLSGITVATLTGLTTNASGILPPQTNANIIIGTVYRVVGADTAGNEFRNKVTAT